MTNMLQVIVGVCGSWVLLWEDAFQRFAIDGLVYNPRQFHHRWASERLNR